jgi:2-succinyl-6-hydroxy-2,4-cyclohexadiene-1-carboxylate synthase
MLLTLDNLRYHVVVAGVGPPLLLLHGFTGAAEAWAPLLPRLAAGRRVIAPDLPGHGATGVPARPERTAITAVAADMLALLDALDAPRADVLGYSMGGRLALTLAAAAPARVRRLVLESATAGLDDPAARAARIADDEALAQALECEGIAAFVARWEALPLFATQAALPAETQAWQRAQRLRNDPRGLAASLRGMGTGRMPPLWGRLSALTMPALVLAGARDTKFAALARRLAAALPAARLAIIPDAGHAIHLERPDVFIEEVRTFLGLEDT